MNKILKNIIPAGLADILGLFGVPTATANAIYTEIIEKRKTEALEILFSELRQGNFLNTDRHELISVIARFQRDAMEGIAKNNLRLLAQVIRGMGNKKELTAPSFYKYADALSSLTEDEIAVLGYMAVEGGCFESCKKDLLKKYSEEQCNMILQSLLRTGLIYFSQGLEAEYKERRPNEMEEQYSYDTIKEVKTDFWTNYSFTPLMDEILKYVDLLIDSQETKNVDVA